MKKIILFLLSIALIFSLCGCVEENDHAATGQQCVDCNAAATHLAGTGWIESLNRNGTLYLCDECYEERMQWYEDNNRVVEERW